MPDGKLAISHLQFNGWSEKQVHERDALMVALDFKLPVSSIYDLEICAT